MAATKSPMDAELNGTLAAKLTRSALAEFAFGFGAEDDNIGLWRGPYLETLIDGEITLSAAKSTWEPPDKNGQTLDIWSSAAGAS